MKVRSSSSLIAASGKTSCEDRLITRPLENGGLLCVLSDGVGRARDPGRCAERVIRLVADNYSAKPRDWSLEKVFKQLANQANESLMREGLYLDGTNSMQATLASCALDNNQLYGLNAGDSPVFLIRNGCIEELSRRHQIRSASGEEQLTQAVGMGEGFQPHYFEKALLEKDLVLICSDGILKSLALNELCEMALRFPTARTLFQELVTQRKIKAEDDWSLIMAQVEELGETGQAPQLNQSIPHPVKGERIDGYLLQSRISGNDRVWLGVKEGQRVVIKFVPLEAETDDSGTIRARFSREIWYACRLRGEFFVPSRPAADGSLNYYIMDYLEAPSLKLLLKSRYFSADEAVSLGKFLCQAGQFLLAQELVHSDIKPENLLVFPGTNEVGFKLLDLGVAGTVFTDHSTSGTPSYLAPERFNGAMVTERSEIFSIGATLYESLSGRPPFGQIERFQRPNHQIPPRLSRINPNVPVWLENVISKCLSLDTERRYSCYSELYYALTHPETAPMTLNEGPLLERNPLLFYQIGFWTLLVLCTGLMVLLMRH